MRKNGFLKLSLFAIIAMFLFSCEKGGEQVAVAKDVDILLVVRDSEGNDLLNPNNPNAINLDSIKIIYEVNGEQVIYYDELMDSPNGFNILEIEGVNYFGFLVNTDINSKPVTYVQWSENDIDKFSYKIVRNQAVIEEGWIGGSSIYVSKVWLMMSWFGQLLKEKELLN